MRLRPDILKKTILSKQSHSGRWVISSKAFVDNLSFNYLLCLYNLSDLNVDAIISFPTHLLTIEMLDQCQIQFVGKSYIVPKFELSEELMIR